MPERNVVHSTFTLERNYSSSTKAVFEAWANQEEKAAWFSGNQEEYELDFRPGGLETNRMLHDGKRITWQSLYREIVQDERIVYTSVLSENDTLATVSLTTVEFESDGEGTKLVLIEAGAYLDGRELPEWREEGTASWLDSLGKHLEKNA
jgi:uncharacterized protein YndB with AHSA1/START domain